MAAWVKMKAYSHAALFCSLLKEPPQTHTPPLDLPISVPECSTSMQPCNTDGTFVISVYGRFQCLCSQTHVLFLYCYDGAHDIQWPKRQAEGVLRCIQNYWARYNFMKKAIVVILCFIEAGDSILIYNVYIHDHQMEHIFPIYRMAGNTGREFKLAD